MQSRSGRTVYKVKTIGRLKDRKTRKVIKSFKESGGGKKPLFNQKAGGVMKANKGKMAKGYSKGGVKMRRMAKGGTKMMRMSKGGTKMMKAMGGRMMKSKGYSKGGTKMMKAMGGRMMKSKGYSKGGAKMNLTALRRAAGGMGYKLTKK